MNLLPLMLCYERTVLVASVHVSASTCDLAALVGVSVCLGPSLQMERQLLIMKSCFEAFHMHWHTNYPAGVGLSLEAFGDPAEPAVTFCQRQSRVVEWGDVDTVLWFADSVQDAIVNRKLQQCYETESTTENCLFCGFFENPILVVELVTLFKAETSHASHTDALSWRWSAMGGQGRKEEGRIQRRILQGRERQTLGGHVESGEETMHVSITKCQLPSPKKKRNSADDASQMEVWLMSFTSHFHTVKPHQLLLDALQVWSASNLKLGFLKILRLNSRSYCTSQLLTIESQSCLLLRSCGHAWVPKRCMRWLCFSLSQPIKCLAC